MYISHYVTVTYIFKLVTICTCSFLIYIYNIYTICHKN